MILTIGRMQISCADQFMEKLGLYRGQGRLLLILSDQDGLTHSEIAKKLEISPAAATKVIKRMEKLQYLQRQPDPADERVSRVFLKNEGWAVVQQIRRVFWQVDQILFRDFSEQDHEVLNRLFNQMYHNLLDPQFDSLDENNPVPLTADQLADQCSD